MGSTSRIPFADDSESDNVSLTSTVEEGDFDAERICSEVPTQDPNEVHYLVKWEGWPMQASTIEPYENLEGCVDLLAEWEAEKELVRAGKKAKFDLDAWWEVNRAYLEEKVKRKARRAKKKRELGLASAAPDSHSDGLFIREYHPDSEADEPAPRKRQKTSRVERKGLAQSVMKSRNRVAVDAWSSEESSDDTPIQDSLDDRDFLMDEVNNGTIPERNTRRAPPDLSSKQLKRNATTTKFSTANASNARNPAAKSGKKRKVSQLDVSRADVTNSATSKPQNGAVSNAKSANILTIAPAEVTEPKKKSMAKRTAPTTKPVNIFSNWTDPKAKPRSTTRVSGETPKDSAEPKFNKLSTQYKYQRYGVNEPPPNPDAVGTFNPATERIESAKGPIAAPAAPSISATLPSPPPPSADVATRRPSVHDAGRSAQAAVEVQKPTASVPVPPAPMRQNLELARAVRQTTPPAPRPDAGSVFGRRSTPPQARARTPSPPAPVNRDDRPHNAFTVTCERWKAGHCHFGDRCHFAHTHNPARDRRPAERTSSAIPTADEKSRIECLYWRRGHCDKDDDVCWYAHHETGFYIEYPRSKKVMVRPNVQPSHDQQVEPPTAGLDGPESDGEIIEHHVPSHQRNVAEHAPPPPPPVAIPKSYQFKLITCHFWRTQGTCSRSNSCAFAHRDTGYFLEKPGSKIVLQTAQAASRPDDAEHVQLDPTSHLIETAASEGTPMGEGHHLGDGMTASPIHLSPVEHSGSQSVVLSMSMSGKDTSEFSVRFLFKTKQGELKFAEGTRSQKRMEMSKTVNAGDLQHYLKDTLQKGSGWPAGGLVADDASSDHFLKFVEVCRLHAVCGVVSTPEYTVLVFPSGAEEWKFLAPAQSGSNSSHALQFKLLPAFPAQCQTPVVDSMRALSISSNDTSVNLSGRHLLGLHTDRMLVTSDGKINMVFIMMPLSREAEIETLTKLFEAKGCKVSSNRKAGAWDNFRRVHYQRFLLIVHPEVPLRSIYRLGPIVASGTMRVFSVGVNTQPLDEGLAPRYDCKVLFPHGEVVLIPDDMFYLQPQTVIKILKTAADINAKTPMDADHATRMKVATRPGIREWLHQLVLDKSLDRGRHDPRWADQFQALCDLHNDSAQSPGNSLASSDIIEAKLPGYNDLPPAEATDLLVSWFGMWSEHHATDYRRFTICNHDLMEDATDPLSWGATYRHINVLPPAEWFERQRKMQPPKK